MKSIGEIRKEVTKYSPYSYSPLSLILDMLVDHIEQLEKDVRELREKPDNTKEDAREKQQINYVQVGTPNVVSEHDLYISSTENPKGYCKCGKSFLNHKEWQKHFECENKQKECIIDHTYRIEGEYKAKSTIEPTWESFSHYRFNFCPNCGQDLIKEEKNNEI